MNILHVLSQFQVTGAETYAVTLAEQQLEAGHRVIIVSDNLHLASKAEYRKQPIGIRKYGQRIKNIRFLRKLLRDERIDVVHAHSRAASWVSYFAVLGTRIPLVSTVHGRQHLHTSTRLFDMYGDRVITVCDDLKTHLVEEVGMKPEKITVIPNGFRFEPVQSELPAVPHRILTIAGRTTGPKGERTIEVIRRVLPSLVQQVPDLQVEIIGGKFETIAAEAQQVVNDFRSRFPDRLNWVGFVNNLEHYLQRSNLVIGSGRVAIESLCLETPLIAFGESQYHGLVSPVTIVSALASNFGDIIPTLPVPAVDYDQMLTDLVAFFTKSTPVISFRKRVEELYNVDQVAASVMDVYQSTRMKKAHPRHIPVLMYHKIPDQAIPSKHRIFVPKNVFARHLAYFKKAGLTPITFRQYDAFRKGEFPLEQFPRKPIFLTFDDAYLDNYTNAFPMMQSYGFRGTIFSLGDEKHRDNFWDVAEGEVSVPLMNTAQKLEMQAYGFEFGAHTMNHTNLTLVGEEQVRNELEESKRELECQLGMLMISFAYPYARLNEQVKELTRHAGYRYAVALDSGGLHLEDDPLEIFRVYVFPEDLEPQLRKKTASWYRRYFRWKRKK